MVHTFHYNIIRSWKEQNVQHDGSDTIAVLRLTQLDSARPLQAQHQFSEPVNTIRTNPSQHQTSCQAWVAVVFPFIEIMSDINLECLP